MLPALLLQMTVLSCQQQVTEPAPSLLLVILDDVGAEYLPYAPQGQESGAPANTPNLSALADEGVRYTNLWVTPVCSATRAALYTGRYGHRTGVGCVIKPADEYELSVTETTIARRLAVRGYETALFGKWHLGPQAEHPCSMGFDTWRGTQANVKPGNYWLYEWTDDTSSGESVETVEYDYLSERTTDAALAWIGEQVGPWFAVVAYQSAHGPLHDPPGVVTSGAPQEQYRAMIENVDAEIGRLLAGVDLDQVTVLVLPDNGPQDASLQWPNTPGHSKFTTYRGGVETTMIAAGHMVRRAIASGKNEAGQEFTGHAHAVDFYKTSLRLCPAILPDPGGWPETDSLPLLTQQGQWIDAARTWNFTEQAEPLGVPPGGPYTDLSRACEEGGWKAVWDETGAVELYDVAADPWEAVDLLLDGISASEQATLDGLDARLAELGIP